MLARPTASSGTQSGTRPAAAIAVMDGMIGGRDRRFQDGIANPRWAFRAASAGRWQVSTRPLRLQARIDQPYLEVLPNANPTAPERIEVRTDMAQFFSSGDELRTTSTMKQ